MTNRGFYVAFGMRQTCSVSRTSQGVILADLATIRPNKRSPGEPKWGEELCVDLPPVLHYILYLNGEEVFLSYVHSHISPAN